MGKALTREDVAENTPLRLATAAVLAFPDGSMSASGLRREHARGRLTIQRIAGKDYTTLAAIAEMIEACPVAPKAPISSSKKPRWTRPAASSGTQAGSSETESARSALDAARMRLAKLSNGLLRTSPSSMPQRESATVTPLR